MSDYEKSSVVTYPFYFINLQSIHKTNCVQRIKKILMREVFPELPLSPPVKYFYWPFQGGASFVDHLCLFLSCVCYAFVHVCALWSHAGKGLTSWLSFVVSNCEFVTFSLVFWVRFGTWLYKFLIFAPLLTLKTNFLSFWEWLFGTGFTVCSP